MLDKLQAKFVALIMACVSLVLAIAFGAICFLTYSQDISGVSALMQDRLDHAANAKTPPPDNANMPPHIGGGQTTRAELTPVVVYEVNKEGATVSLPGYSTALISDEYLDQAIADALEAKEDFGHLPSSELLYGKRTLGDTSYIAFADEASVNGWKNLALTLLVVGILTLAGFWMISIRFSRWALAPVERAWTQQRQFIADASHELKTPLTVILANTAIVQSHPEASVESQGQWIDSTQTEAKRMQGLVNDMLELAQIDAGIQTEEGFERVDLSDIAEGEALQFESVAFESGVAMETSIEAGVTIAGNQARLQRLVRVLMDNACKYAGPEGRVSVKLTRDSKAARLTVRNSGTVIDAADLPHIFDRFYRADESRTRSTNSFGLGLAIAREIARDHKGDIEVASNQTEGTTFSVTLPL